MPAACRYRRARWGEQSTWRFKEMSGDRACLSTTLAPSKLRLATARSERLLRQGVCAGGCCCDA